uniref:BTB domain-containing protein n=1 Tax=Panagrolaimus sp. PS1159 TaxID=55785 RepID=A0AC35FVS0_9BILA
MANEWQQQQNNNYDSFSGENNLAQSHIELESVLEGTSTVSIFSPTFKWKIGNLNLYDFQANPIFDGPRLFAIDHSNNGKIYDVHFSLTSDISNDDDIDEYGHYEIICNFNTPPVKIEYQYIINETIFNGSLIKNPSLNESINNILINVKAFYYITKESKKSGIAISINYENVPTSLRSDLLKLFKNDLDSQFIIECAGEEIMAYKPIMQARSSTFNKLLSNGTDRLRIEDFSPKIVKKVIEFCNFEFIENFENEEKTIFSMARTYKIESLMAYSSKEIIENANNENIIELYKFAEFYNYEPLKKWLLNYIIKNLNEISAFKSLDSDLYKPILKELLKQKKIF